MKPTRLEYYEDIYDETIPDEEFDRFPDALPDREGEFSSSDGESAGSNENSESENKLEGFFAGFRKTKPEQSVRELVERRKYGRTKRRKGKSRVVTQM
jgi:hypothetical protein